MTIIGIAGKEQAAAYTPARILISAA